MLLRAHAIVTFSIIIASAIGATGCEKDVVLPSVVVPAVCGNFILEEGEQCDVASPGCIGCRVAPEWTCPGNVCSVDCNDPGVNPGISCARVASCNMEGYWAVRETDYTAPGEHVLQTSTQWYLYHLTQPPGADRYSIDTALDCGIHVTGVATVDYTPNTEKFLMYKSGIDGSPDGPRQGTAEQLNGGLCNVSLDRFFFVRGATSDFLPAKSEFDIDASLPPAATLPWLGAPPLPAQPPGTNLAYQKNIPAGSVNTNGDAGGVYPGGAFQISGTINGLRHSAQRDYKGYASTSPVPPNSLSFTFPGNYSLQESVLSVTDCLDKGSTILCGLLATIAFPALDKAPFVTFSFIGSDLTSSRTSSVIVGTPKKTGYPNDLATCGNILLILPHDGSIHDGSPPPDASAD
jgi:hypothetical protein